MKKLQHSEQGYALVVIAALFLAFSVVIAVTLDKSVATAELDRQQSVRDNLSRMNKALIKYAYEHDNRYPCPAALNVAFSNAAFGTQASPCDSGAVTGMDILPDAAGEVLRGMVPVRTLVPYGISLEDAFDSWGNRIMYVVNRQKTETGTGNVSQNITLSEVTTGSTVVNPDVMLISLGKDKLGGVHRSANAAISPGLSALVTTCAASTAPRLENCDGDLSFVYGPPMTSSSATADNYFDDVVSYFSNAAIGKPYCWGLGTGGQIGDGGITSRSSPTLIPNTEYTTISAGSVHSCGIDITGAAFCWGTNTNGQLGDNTVAQRLTPTAVSGGYLFKQIVASVNFTCGLKTNGMVMCWGDNTNGQLGDNTVLERHVPTAVSGDPVFVQITAGASHVCGLKTSGAVWCWGYNAKGSVGDGTLATPKKVPTLVTGSHIFTQMDSGEGNSSCGLLTTGAAWCWGQGGQNQLGDAGSTDRSSPVAVGGGNTFVSAYSAMNHSCAIKSDGSAYCWGQNAGLLGDASTTNRSAPTAVAGSHAFNMLSIGGFSCGLSNGAAYCWGATNAAGQIGNGTTGAGAVTSPTSVTGNYSFNYISVGSQHACGLASSSGSSSGGGTPADCTLPWGGTIASGVSTTAYNVSSSATCGCDSHSTIRTCTDGTLGGGASYSYGTCTDSNCGGSSSSSSSSSSGGGCMHGCPDLD